ncbi:MAG: class I SAM-dependent methyltransferase [Pseudobdellovibrionaceae bacterium]|jgi:ubiquinone/menaquinone biosynthesis C-methylase UbiE
MKIVFQPLMTKTEIQFILITMSQVKNLFVEQEEAKRYNLYRPVYHHLIAEKLLEFFGQKIKRVLDVACGTGHSTKALAVICESIVGCDLSDAMLVEARKNSDIDFLRASAEDLPFKDAEFDYLNISMAFQWLNQEKFLNEAKRVLHQNGLLGIDNYGFTGKMIGDDHFLEIYKSFDQTYMKPVPRNKNYPDSKDLGAVKIKFVQEISYDHHVEMNKQQFINYLMTRSNFLELSIIERKSVELQLNDFYEESFEGQNKTLLFRGMIKLFRPTGVNVSICS